MVITEKVNNVVITKATFEEYLDLALHGKPHRLATGKGGRSSRDYGNGDWSGTDSWSEAVKLAEEGYPKGRERIGSILTDIESKTQDIETPMPVWDVAGDFVDVGAYVTGEPECMVRWDMEPLAKPVVKVWADIGGSAGVSREALEWRGACVLALIDKLESSGVRVELDMGRGMDGSWVEIITVKRAQEPLSLDTLSFHLGCAAGFRRLLFSFEETQDEGMNHGCYGGHGYGHPDFDISSSLASQNYDLIIPGFQLHDIDRAIAKVEDLFSQVFTGDKFHQK